MADSLCPFATTELGRSFAPVPISAVKSLGGFTICFDRSLSFINRPGPGGWTVRYGGNNWPVTNRLATGIPQTCLYLLSPAAGVPDVGPDAITYAPPPDDAVDSATLQPALPFTGYPIT